MDPETLAMQAHRATFSTALAHATRWMWVNTAIAIAGAVISVASFAAAEVGGGSGGRYIVFWGAVIFGGWGAIKNYVARRRARRALGVLDEWLWYQVAALQQQTPLRTATGEGGGSVVASESASLYSR